MKSLRPQGSLIGDRSIFITLVIVLLGLASGQDDKLTNVKVIPGDPPSVKPCMGDMPVPNPQLTDWDGHVIDTEWYVGCLNVDIAFICYVKSAHFKYNKIF